MSDDKNKGEETVDFLTKMIKEDVENSVYNRPVATRFPPEPNGYLHIGSAYAIYINHSIASRFHGTFNLRFDDTNPLKEDIKYVHAIQEDIEWLGLKPNVYFGSDYADQIAEAARKLIAKGKAYVCDLTPEQMTEYRGTLTEAGINSPFRERSIEENMALFEQMIAGAFHTSEKYFEPKSICRPQHESERSRPVSYHSCRALPDRNNVVCISDV